MFANVEANLLYIQEENLTPEFQSKLCSLFQSELPLYVIVQLKILPANFQPLMNKLTDIRKDKAEKKIINWEKYCHRNHSPVKVSVIENPEDLLELPSNVKQIKKLNIHCLQFDRSQILALLENNFTVEQLRFNSI